MNYRYACLWRPVVVCAFLSVAIALSADGQTQAFACLAVPDDAGHAPGCGCENDDGTLPDTGDWGLGQAAGGLVVKALPGTTCHMNVGNINFTLPNAVKIDSCAHLLGRAAEIAGADCDTISLVELMSDHQCAEICSSIPSPPWYWPPTQWQEWIDAWQEICRVCRGCADDDTYPAGSSCELQAALVCPRERYDIHCSQAPDESVGCDCLCTKRDPCSAHGPHCESQRIEPQPDAWTRPSDGAVFECSPGNYATCTVCDDPYGGPSTGTCVVHPDHCNDSAYDIKCLAYTDVAGCALITERNRQACLNICSTGLVAEAAIAIARADVRTMTGDFNCTPNGRCDGGAVSIAACPWLHNGFFAGMQVCPQTDHTAAVGAGGQGGGLFGAGNPNCMLDFVLSSHCGCGQTRAVMNGIDYGDHRTIIYSAGQQPTLEYIPGSGHVLVHGHSVVLQADGSSATLPWAWEGHDGPFGYSCGVGASCGYKQGYGQVVAEQGVCESRHDARVRQAAGCFATGKALLCEQAGAWAMASGQGSGHAADTVDQAGANASAAGGHWQGRCDERRRIVDLVAQGPTDVVSAPIPLRANADAACTLRPPPTPEPRPNPTPENTPPVVENHVIQFPFPFSIPPDWLPPLP